jgi:hypothetical protein
VNLALRALVVPETLTDEEREIVAEGKRAYRRQQGLIDQLWVSAMLGALPWPGSIDA